MLADDGAPRYCYARAALCYAAVIARALVNTPPLNLSRAMFTRARCCRAIVAAAALPR